MGTKHPHYDVIVAWANGEEIQFRKFHDEEWKDHAPTITPRFYEDYEYRIKPNTVKKEAWVNVYSGNHKESYDTKNEADKAAIGRKRYACIRIEWEEEI
jgi:hypothetical protein